MDPKMAAGLLARHLLTSAAGVLAAHGYINSNGKEQFIGAGMVLLGVAWSWYQKTGRVLVDAEIARMRGLKACIAFLAFTLLALGMFSTSAHATDVIKPKFSFAAPTPCLPTSCTGFYLGANLTGTMANADVIGNGIGGSFAGGGQSIGAQFGYQFANGTYFFGPEVGLNYVVGGGQVVDGSAPPKYRAYEIMKLGTSLATLLGVTAPAGPSPAIPEKLAAQVISPYIFFGAVENGIGNGWATGAGVEFALTANWFIDTRYSYIKYGGGGASVSPSETVKSENLVTLGFNYKF